MPTLPPPHTVHLGDVATLLETVRPASLLLLDPNPDGIPASYRAAQPDCRIAHLSGDELTRLEALGQFDVAIVANTLEYLERKTAGQLLARLRDVQTRRFVVLVPLGAGWPEQVSVWQLADLLGYGMSIMARYQSEGKPLALCHYAIETYKATPEWFNSHHWAHPERWQP